jgi:serine phosphatase RsbU (regulator of sigma subunit)
MWARTLQHSYAPKLILFLLVALICVEIAKRGRIAIFDQKAETQKTERLATELSLASQIQNNILPNIFPVFPERKEFELFASMTTAKEVGGDFYDFFMIDDDHIALVMADVSGKGIGAALFMMVARTLIKNQALSASDKNTPCDILYAVNNQLCEGNSMEYFVTAWLGILELSSGKLVYASAGHEYPAASLSGGDFVIYKKKNAPPLGTMENLKFRGGEITLSAGDTVYIYTDGVTDAMNAKKELFGLDRMLDTLNANVNADLKTIDDSIRGRIQDFVKDTPQFDDITMLSIRYNGNNGAKKNQI